MAFFEHNPETSACAPRGSLLLGLLLLAA